MSKSGSVKWFNSERGYGFITVVGEPDVFVHISDCKKSGLSAELDEGDKVEFQTKETPRGVKAVDIRVTQVAQSAA